MTNSSNVRPVTASKPAPPDALTAMAALVAEDMAVVNETILERMHSPVALIPQLAGHLIASGGKRLRPMLTLACGQMLGLTGTRHARLAACVEFIHTATLLHDDVVDESGLRRGKESANALWGNQASVLVGDFLFSRAFELMTEDGSLKVLRTLSEAARIIAEGEVLQLSITNDLSTGEDAYLEVISAKTAALFAAACRIAAIVGACPGDEEEALAAFGSNLGIAFQLTDDVLDYGSAGGVPGKNIGDDFKEGKITLPIILAYRRGIEEERQFWDRTLGDLDQKPGDLERATALVARHNGLKETLERAQGYGDKARHALADFPDNAARQGLLAIIDFCIDRAT